MRHAPWLVANLHLDAAARRPARRARRPGTTCSTAAPALGYVDAMHQSLRPFAGPTVLTAYWALGGDDAAELAAQRARLLSERLAAWAERVVADLAAPHPDLPRQGCAAST